MALSTNNQNDINTMCSRAKEFSIGSRLKNITTAGAYNDGTVAIGAVAGTITDGTASLVGGALSGVTLSNPTFSGGAEDFEIDSIPITNQFSTSITTVTSTSIGQGGGGGFYRMPTTDITSCVVKLDTAPSAGDYLIVYNPTNVTGHLSFSSAGTIVGLFKSGASFVDLQMETNDWIELVALNSTVWLVVNPYTSAAFASYATTT